MTNQGASGKDIARPIFIITITHSMVYKFTAKSHVALSVPVGKGSAHVSFIEKTGSGSVYYTDNEKLAAAMRKHPKFGKLFKEEKVEEAPAAEAPKTDAGTGDEASAAEQPKVSFSNNEDAKEYFADRFGVSRSKLRTRQEIEEVAKANNIVVEWTE